jgi:hypothetical protein
MPVRLKRGVGHRTMIKAFALLIAVAVLAGCVSTISPVRQDFVIVDGHLSTSGGDWTCGTVPRQDGGFFYVCDMAIDVRRVVFGQHPRNTITARFFHLETDEEDAIVTGPHIKTDRRAAAILWRNEDGPGSYILMEFPGRWCVPDWMSKEFSINDAEIVKLRRAGYPLCSADDSAQ